MFVMEEEYRMQKAQAEAPNAGSTSDDGLVIHEDGSAVPTSKRQSAVSGSTTLVSKSDPEADDDASIRGVREPSRPSTTQGSLDASHSIPTIRISTESDIDREIHEKAKAEANGHGDAHAEGEVKEAEEPKVNGVPIDTLEKPVQAAAESGSDGGDAPPTPTTTTDAFSFSNKRLCERWLDNLFMVLYEVRSLFSLNRIPLSVL